MRRQSSVPPELPGYTFVKLLGSGGFSDVFLYDQKLPRRRVAVKVLLTEDLTSASRAAFVAEANLMAQLSAHPYIVTIYQADVASDDRPYFVMEYCSGPSLAERYKSETFAVADALRTGVRLSSAVATAHAAGILHRDIKPGNVLSNDYGWPALTDFGISSAVDDEALPIHTTTITRGGAGDATGGTESQSIGMSVPWSPPEMFEDDPQPDVRSDVFSLAATIYTILAGQTPFEVRGRSNGTLDLIGRIERGAITPMTRDDIPRSLTAVLQKGMASNRADRFATATDFARALQRVELELGYSPTTIEVPNVAVEAPVRAAEGEDDDATRARTVATILAQPTTAAPAAPSSTDADPTLLRSARNVVAQPEVQSETVVRQRTPAPPEVVAPPEAPVAPPEPEQPKSLVGRVILWVSLGAAVLVAAAIALALIFGGTPSPVPTPQATTNPGDVIVSASIPTPELVGTPTEAGGVISVTVENPKPEDGDAYLWRISNGPASEAPRREDTDTITVNGFTGEKICLDIRVVRAGQTSPVPLEVCYP